jgi:hypothetical protein
VLQGNCIENTKCFFSTLKFWSSVRLTREHPLSGFAAGAAKGTGMCWYDVVEAVRTERREAEEIKTPLRHL